MSAIDRGRLRYGGPTSARPWSSNSHCRSRMKPTAVRRRGRTAPGTSRSFESPGAASPISSSGGSARRNQPLAAGRLDGDQPWFVPGCSHLLFHSTRDGDHGVFERDVNQAGRARRVSPSDEGTAFVTPFPSPDGRNIVFASAVSGVSQIYAMSRDGTNRQQLTFADEPSFFPAWAPHGDDVLFVRGNPSRATSRFGPDATSASLHKASNKLATTRRVGSFSSNDPGRSSRRATRGFQYPAFQRWPPRGVGWGEAGKRYWIREP